MSGLFGSTTVEVAIGLFVVYWLLSTVCSTIQETIASWLKWRARDLENGVLNLLCDRGTALDVLNHPLIKAMGNTRAETEIVQRLADGSGPVQAVVQAFKGSTVGLVSLAGRAVGWQVNRDFAGKPSYIPARTFSMALFDSLAPSTGGPLTVERLQDRAQALATLTKPADLAGTDLRDGLLALHQQFQDVPRNLSVLKTGVPTVIVQNLLDEIDKVSATGLSTFKGDLTAQLKALQAKLAAARPEKLSPTMVLPLGVDARVTAEVERLTSVLEDAQDALKQATAAGAQATATVIADCTKAVTETEDALRQLQALHDAIRLPTMSEAREALLALVNVPLQERTRQEIDARTLVVMQAKQAIGRTILSTIEASRDPALLYERVQQVKAIAEAHPPDPDKQEMLTILAPARTIGELRQMVEQVSPGNALKPKMIAVVDALEKQADMAQVKLETVRTNFEHWFDHSMDRVTGIYTRRTRTWVLFIALLVTMVLGADTIRIAQFLAENATVRAALVNEAGAIVRTPAPSPVPVSSPGTTAQQQQQEQQNEGGRPSADATPTPAASASTNQLLTDLRSLKGLLGYDDIWPPHDADGKTTSNLRAIPIVALISKIAGLLLTTFAVSLGAPFWFDLLQRLVNVRATGPKPEVREAKQQGAQGSS